MIHNSYMVNTMSINNAQINNGATAVTPTGGTAITLIGTGIQNNVHPAYVSEDTSLKTRRTVAFQVKAPQANSKSIGGYTQAYRKVRITFPRTLTDGSITNDELFIQLRSDISATDAELQNEVFVGAQVLADPEFAAFWKALNLT